MVVEDDDPRSGRLERRDHQQPDIDHGSRYPATGSLINAHHAVTRIHQQYPEAFEELQALTLPAVHDHPVGFARRGHHGHLGAGNSVAVTQLNLCNLVQKISFFSAFHNVLFLVSRNDYGARTGPGRARARSNEIKEGMVQRVCVYVGISCPAPKAGVRTLIPIMD